MTPREAAKLQSFSKKYKLENEIENDNNVTRHHAYMQLGNSVNVQIVEMIIEEMLNKYEN